MCCQNLKLEWDFFFAKMARGNFFFLEWSNFLNKDMVLICWISLKVALFCFLLVLALMTHGNPRRCLVNDVQQRGARSGESHLFEAVMKGNIHAERAYC